MKESRFYNHHHHYNRAASPSRQEAPPPRVMVGEVTPPRLMIDGRDVRSEAGMPSRERPHLPGFSASKPRPCGGRLFGVTSSRDQEQTAEFGVRGCVSQRNVAGTENLALLSSRHDEGCTILMFVLCELSAC